MPYLGCRVRRLQGLVTLFHVPLISRRVEGAGSLQIGVFLLLVRALRREFIDVLLAVIILFTPINKERARLFQFLCSPLVKITRGFFHINGTTTFEIFYALQTPFYELLYILTLALL